jgi:hypothetical protein
VPPRVTPLRTVAAELSASCEALLALRGLGEQFDTVLFHVLDDADRAPTSNGSGTPSVAAGPT